ncbi:hypothetical protein ACJW31_09G073300 [Castanea mollissima]
MLFSLSLSLSISPTTLTSSPRFKFHSCPHVLPPTPKPPPPRLRASSQAHHVILHDNGTVAGAGAPVEENILPAGLRRESMPRHVALVMDGNRRWARIRGLPVGSGYEAGVRSLRSVVELCCKLGIRVLSVFAFSSENWFRPQAEVEFLMELFERGMRDEMGSLLRENIRISVIGDSSKLSRSLQELITRTEETTKTNCGLQLIVAVSYSGQYDIVQACQKIALKVKDGLIEPNDINESLIKQELETNCTEFPYPDLLIRTSGELRISNFLLWQLAYTELFFAQSLWPDFGEVEFLEALQAFQQRQRRYGGRDF